MQIINASVWLIPSPIPAGPKHWRPPAPVIRIMLAAEVFSSHIPKPGQPARFLTDPPTDKEVGKSTPVLS